MIDMIVSRSIEKDKMVLVLSGVRKIYNQLIKESNGVGINTTVKQLEIIHGKLLKIRNGQYTEMSQKSVSPVKAAHDRLFEDFRKSLFKKGVKFVGKMGYYNSWLDRQIVTSEPVLFTDITLRLLWNQ